jgi:hypothetical protein
MRGFEIVGAPHEPPPLDHLLPPMMTREKPGELEAGQQLNN